MDCSYPTMHDNRFSIMLDFFQMDRFAGCGKAFKIMQINIFSHFITWRILTAAPFCPHCSETGLNTTSWVKKKKKKT